MAYRRILEVIKCLTATERAASRLPKSSKMFITAEMSTIAQKLLERLPEIQKQIFWCYKNFQKKFSGRNFTGNEPKIDWK